MQVKSPSDTDHVPVRCSEEKVIVGHLQLPTGRKHTLTWQVILGAFVPVDREHTLPATTQPDGLFRCPRCPGHLTLAGKMKSTERPDPRAGNVRVRSEVEADDLPIMIGRTTMEVMG